MVARPTTDVCSEPLFRREEVLASCTGMSSWRTGCTRRKVVSWLHLSVEDPLYKFAEVLPTTQWQKTILKALSRRLQHHGRTCSLHWQVDKTRFISVDGLVVLADAHEQANKSLFAFLSDFDSGQDLKLIDFGLSKFWRPDKSMEMRATLPILAARGFKFALINVAGAASVRSLVHCQLLQVSLSSSVSVR